LIEKLERNLGYEIHRLLLNFIKLGIGDWGLGICDWGFGIGPNPQF